MRIIGDVHGMFDRYQEIISEVEHSVQVGDFGFDYSRLRTVDPDKHRIVAGNHDNYGTMNDYPHFLGDFGTYVCHEDTGIEIFFIRGGRSIDWRTRIEGVNLWREQEQLGFRASLECIAEYTAVKPDIVISHEAPTHANELICDNGFNLALSHTSLLLQHCFEIHQPKLWFFGHWHKDWECYYDGIGVTAKGQEICYGEFAGTTFYCLDELSYIDL